MQNGKSANSLVDKQEVYRALNLLVEPGHVVEVRALEASMEHHARYTETLSGYFDNAADLIRAIGLIREAMGIYITLQPCHPDMLHRAKNKLVQQKKGFSTPDKYITAYRWLLIDSDPERVAGISSTDEEHEQALAHSRTIRDALTREGWPSPMLADSGNGAHLLYRIDLPTTDSDLVRRVLEGLAQRFDEEAIHVDQTVYNPARICKLYGTLACKGDHTAERPHRLSRLLVVPAALAVVTRAQLEALAVPTAMPKTAPTRREIRRSNRKTFDLSAWIERHGIETDGEEAYQNGRRWVLKTCPWNATHTDRSAVIIERADGTIGAMCHHNGCHGKSWKDLRMLYEPDANLKPSRTPQGRSSPDDLPQIILGEQLRDTCEQALDALSRAEQANPTLFVHLSRLCLLTWEKDGSPILVQMSTAGIKNALTNAANFYKTRMGRYGVELIDTYPPMDIAEALLNLEPHQWPFAELSALTEMPVLRPDGTILGTPGYDPLTQLYYAQRQNMKECQVPDQPTQADVARSLSLLHDAIGEFPYETATDYANMLALLLTPIVRPTIKGDVQMALLNATKAGTGKGYLAHVVSIIATGKTASTIKLPDTEDEFEKRIGSKLLAGSTLMIIDNITRKLVSATLEQVLTCGGSTQVRPLGQSKMQTAYNKATWIATGNNLQIGGDLGRRCYQVRLISPVSNPEERDDFKIQDLPTWCEEHRAELIVALLTLSRAWYAAGKPPPKHIPKLGSFTNWAKTIGGILEYVGIEGFQGNRTELKTEANKEEGQTEAFLHAWLERFGTDWIPAKKLADEIEKSSDAFETPANRLAESVPDDLVFKLKDKPKTFTLTLTKWLERRVKTPYGCDNIRIERQFDKHARTNLWRVLLGSAGVATASSQKNYSETTKEDVENMQGRTDGNDPCRPQQEDEEPGRDRGRYDSGSHLNTAEQCAGVCDTSEKAPTGQNISAWEPSSLGLCCTCLDENVETAASYIGPEDILYCQRHALCCKCGAQAEHVSPDGYGYCTDCSQNLGAFSSELVQVSQLPQSKQAVAQLVEPAERQKNVGVEENLNTTPFYTLSANEPCSTRFEKNRKGVHEAVATQIVAGYAWCDRCTVQQQWMAYGEAHHYPHTSVSGERGFVVKAGPDEWLRFACHAGYAMVEQAVRAIAPQAALSPVPDPLLQQLRDLIQPWCEKPSPIALDLETTGLDCRSDCVISIALGTPGNVTILDMRPYYGLSPQALAHWKQMLATLFHQEGITWVGHNLKFDWAFLYVHFDLKLRQVYDTMLAEQVLLAGSPERRAFTLKDVAKRHDLSVTKEQRAWFEGLDKRQAAWNAPFPEEQERYMIQDVEVAYQIYERQRPHLEKHGLLQVVQLENEALPALAAMEVHGVLIDQTQWRAVLQAKSERALLIEQDLTKTLGQARHDAGHSTEASRAAKYAAYQQALQAYEKRLMQEYRSVQGKRTWSDYRAARLRDWQKTHPDPGQPKAVSSEINLRSSAQLLEALHALGLDVTSTEEEVLEEYAAKSPVVTQLLAWRKLDHFVTAFGEKLLSHVKTDGRIHANFNQVRAVSGRIICRQPNLQQIPRTRGDTAEDIRQCFVAPEGSRILTADLSNIELRILAEFSGDETMLRLFAEGLDLHAETAKLMFQLPASTNTKEHLSNGVPVRDIGKCINFGLAYGMGARGLAKQINVEVDVARELMQRYAATYQGVAAWLSLSSQQAIAQGYATTPLGRKRFFQTASLGKAERASLERSAKNHPIQATNADILKRALCLLFHTLPEGVHLVLVVHDEIVLECPVSLVEEASQILKQVMVAACREYLHTVALPEPEVLIDTFWKKG